MNRHSVRKWIANAARWLHIYLSMVSFAIVFFFAVTGITLNHPDWFSRQQVTQVKGALKPEWLSSQSPAKLDAVEFLRNHHGVRGSLTDFRFDGGQVAISFKGPGYTADAFADPATGAYDLTITTMGAVAILNDLHKGRDSGKVWAAVIDGSAVLLVLVSVTGMILLWFVYRRRISGYATAALGLLASLVLYRVWVP